MSSASGPVNTPIRVALIGHCVPDSGMLKTVVSRIFPACEVVRVNDEQTALDEVKRSDLLLINRQMDGDFPGVSGGGINLIRELLGVPGRKAALMLISNFEDAQQEAVGVGAAPGFGKARAGSAEAAERMRAAVSARVHR